MNDVLLAVTVWVAGLGLLGWLLAHKNLWAGQTGFVIGMFLVCLVVVTGVLYLAALMVAYSFRGRAFEVGAYSLICLMGLALTVLGYRAEGRAATTLMIVGVIIMTWTALTLLS